MHVAGYCRRFGANWPEDCTILLESSAASRVPSSRCSTTSMNAVRPQTQTPSERLQRISRYSLPVTREIRGPRYLIGIALVVALLVLVAIAIAAVSGAAEIFRAYAQWIK